MNEERVLVYAGLTITEDEVKRAVPEAIVRPPAAQADILSDVFKYSPTHVILIDGRFLQHLPPWHKELVYCLLDPRIGGRVYGCSSMGALRAADLADFGIIGYGRIFNWYYENVLTDDSEVSVSYHLDASGTPHVDTVALVDCRSTIEQYCPEDLDPEILLLTARRIHWTVRTEQRLRKAWVEAGFNLEVDIIPQKFLDAGHLLQNFRELPVPGPQGINDANGASCSGQHSGHCRV
jgi:hypothetical protein